MYCLFSKMCGYLGYIDRSSMQYSVNAKQFQSRNVEVVVSDNIWKDVVTCICRVRVLTLRRVGLCYKPVRPFQCKFAHW